MIATTVQGGTWTGKSVPSALKTLMLNVYGFEGMFRALKTATLRQVKMSLHNILKRDVEGRKKTYLKLSAKRVGRRLNRGE